MPAARFSLCPVLHLTTAFDDDVGVRLEQAHQLVAGGHRLAIEYPALGLGDDAGDQRQVMADLRPPAHDGQLGGFGDRSNYLLQLGPAGLGGSDQVAIELALLVLSAAVFDGTGPLLGQAPPIAPADRQRRPRQRLGAVQQPGHDPYRIR